MNLPLHKMPAWGVGYFDNDEALLCLETITNQQQTCNDKPNREIEYLIMILTRSLTKPYFEVHNCSDILIICVLIIGLHSQEWVYSHPDIRTTEQTIIHEFIRRNQTIWDKKYRDHRLDIITLGLRCLQAVLDRKRCECCELWYETSMYREWRNTVLELEKKLLLIKTILNSGSS